MKSQRSSAQFRSVLLGPVRFIAIVSSSLLFLSGPFGGRGLLLCAELIAPPQRVQGSVPQRLHARVGPVEVQHLRFCDGVNAEAEGY